MKVLAVGAHPDDLELLCGGTLARFAAEGHSVTMCHVSRGDRGSYEHSMEEIAAIRLAEASEGARLLGASHVTLGLSDGEVNASDPSQQRLAIDLIRQISPDLILTHDPCDYMSDHVEAGHLFEDASFIASLPLFETEHPGRPPVPALYFFDTVTGLGFKPSEYVDISNFLETKIAALEAHRSQVIWMGEHDGIDFIEIARVASRYRGIQAGASYAEGFRPCLKSLRPRTVRLLP
jgi:LmbE family N-acetylglucosaminyl deacetylase